MKAPPPMQPAPGEVAWREWTATDTGIVQRHVLMVAALRPHPYTRVVARSWGRADVKRYHDWRGQTRDVLRATLLAHRIAPYSPHDWLGVAISAGAVPAAPPAAQRRKDGEVDRRRIRSILAWDSNNVWKAVEDALNGILWPDDERVRFTGPGAFVDTEADWFAVHVWGGPGATCWQKRWDGDSVPYDAPWLVKGT